MIMQQAEILFSLRSPSTATRLAALHQVSLLEPWEELTQTLKEVMAKERDEECLFLLQHIVGEFPLPDLSSETTKGAPRQKKTSVDVVEFLRAWGIGETSEKLRLLSSLSPESRTALGSKVPALLQVTTHPVLEATVIRTFASDWPEAELLLLTPRLSSKSFAVRSAALEALVERSPQSILSAIPRFLASEDPGLRVMAVRGLLKIDPVEAVAHLEAMLLDGEPLQRMLALQSAVLFPFAAIRGVLLKFLALEKDPGLIRNATLMFRMNPDLESPFRLWEIAEDAPSEKAVLLREAVKGAAQAIKDSGMFTGDLDQYMRQLKDWILKRRALRFVQECVSHLSDDAPDVFARLKPPILQSFQQPFMVMAFRASLDWPVNGFVRQFIAGLLPSQEPSMVTDSTTAPGPERQAGPQPVVSPEPVTASVPESATASAFASAFALATPIPQSLATPESAYPHLPDLDSPGLSSLSSEKQLQTIGKWGPEKAGVAQPLLNEILINPGTSSLHWVAALRQAIRLKIHAFREVAEKVLKASDPDKVSLALEYFAFSLPDTIIPLLGRYLKDPHPRVKSTALKILKQDDPQRAISAIFLLLKSANIEERQAANHCLIYFDFDLLRDKLCQLLEQGVADDLVQPTLCLFVSNPSVDNLYALYRLEQLDVLRQRELFRKVRRQCQNILMELGQLSKGDKRASEEELKELWTMEQTRRARPSPGYALKTIQAQEQAARGAFPETFLALIQEFPDWFKIGFPILASMVVIFHLMFSGTPKKPTESAKPQALLAENLKVAMTIEDVDPVAGYIRGKDSQGLVYHFQTREFPIPLPKIGNTCQIAMVPVFLGTNKVIYARPLEVRILSGIPASPSSSGQRVQPPVPVPPTSKPAQKKVQAQSPTIPEEAAMPDHDDPRSVHSLLIERFNQAAELARQGQPGEALRAYEQVFAPVDGNVPRPFGPTFYFTVQLQMAYSAMDLGKYPKAEAILSAKEMTRILPQMPPAGAAKFHLALGNILGNRKNFVGMETSLKKAVALCSQGETETLGMACYGLLNWTKEAQNWNKLETLCQEIHDLGKEKQNFVLQMQAMEFGAHAFLGQGKKEKARRQAEKVLEWYKQAENASKVKEWETFLTSTK